MYESIISFTLDTTCPWTYLAKRRLDRALTRASASDPRLSSSTRFRLRFRPYQLYPDLPSSSSEGSGPLDRRTWYRDTKFAGSEERTRAFEALMEAYGDAADIKLRFGGTTGNTLHAHRLVQYFQSGGNEDAGQHDDDDDNDSSVDPARLETASRLVDGLYKQYFEEGQPPASDETLIRACLSAGIDEAEARRVVGDQSLGLAAVKRAIQQQRSYGVDSVPTIVIEGRKRDLTLVGAKEVDEYVKALQTIAKEAA